MTPDWLAFRLALNGHLNVRRIVCIIPHLYPGAFKAKAKPKAAATADKARHVFAAVCACVWPIRRDFRPVPSLTCLFFAEVWIENQDDA